MTGRFPPHDRGCAWCHALPGEWCAYDCGSPVAVIFPDWLEKNPTAGLWGKRNTPSGYFKAMKRQGKNVLRGVKREN